MGLQRVRHDWPTELNWETTYRAELSERPGLLIVVQKTGRRGNGISLKSLLKVGSWLAHILCYLVISSEVPDDVWSGLGKDQ